IRECSRKLQGVKLTSQDFEAVIEQAPNDCFLYITPPYSIHHTSAECKLHKYPFERKDHMRLADALRRNAGRLKFLVAYNENEELRKMYSWGSHITIFDLHNRPPQKGEIVIMNYKITGAQNDKA
ncbi:MAG: DNA adenine methylase, partial [archaeon]|nr:DNA adenine methylase [archaeon]